MQTAYVACWAIAQGFTFRVPGTVPITDNDGEEWAVFPASIPGYEFELLRGITTVFTVHAVDPNQIREEFLRQLAAFREQQRFEAGASMTRGN